jgi:hypothetical protein
VSRKLCNNEPIDRIQSQNDKVLLARADALIGSLSRFDLNNGNISDLLAEIRFLAAQNQA